MRVMAETGLSKSDVIVGAPICRRTSFALDKFLSNQQEIQKAYSGCRLVLATYETVGISMRRPGCSCGYRLNLYAHVPAVLDQILWSSESSP